MILERLGKDFDTAVKIVGERPGTDAAYMLDSSKIRAELGWSDEISLEDGLGETIEWAARYRDALAEQPLAYIHKP